MSGTCIGCGHPREGHVKDDDDHDDGCLVADCPCDLTAWQEVLTGAGGGGSREDADRPSSLKAASGGGNPRPTGDQADEPRRCKFCNHREDWLQVGTPCAAGKSHTYGPTPSPRRATAGGQFEKLVKELEDAMGDEELPSVLAIGQIPPEAFPAIGPACERGGEIVDYTIGLCSCGQCPTPRPDWSARQRSADVPTRSEYSWMCQRCGDQAEHPYRTKCAKSPNEKHQWSSRGGPVATGCVACNREDHDSCSVPDAEHSCARGLASASAWSWPPVLGQRVRRKLVRVFGTVIELHDNSGYPFEVKWDEGDSPTFESESALASVPDNEEQRTWGALDLAQRTVKHVVDREAQAERPAASVRPCSVTAGCSAVCDACGQWGICDYSIAAQRRASATGLVDLVTAKTADGVEITVPAARARAVAEDAYQRGVQDGRASGSASAAYQRGRIDGAREQLRTTRAVAPHALAMRVVEAARAWRDLPLGDDQDEERALMDAVDAYEASDCASPDGGARDEGNADLDVRRVREARDVAEGVGSLRGDRVACEQPDAGRPNPLDVDVLGDLLRRRPGEGAEVARCETCGDTPCEHFAAMVEALDAQIPKPGADISCSFCRKTQSEVKKLVQAWPENPVTICDECIGICNGMMARSTPSSSLEGGPGFARGYSRGWTDAMRFIQEHGPATASDSGGVER